MESHFVKESIKERNLQVLLFGDYSHKMPHNYLGTQNSGQIPAEWYFVNNPLNPLINIWTWLKPSPFTLSFVLTTAA